MQYTERVQKRPLRRYGSRPATVQVERDLGVKAVVDRQAVATAIGRLGWRVYATNAPPSSLAVAGRCWPTAANTWWRATSAG